MKLFKINEDGSLKIEKKVPSFSIRSTCYRKNAKDQKIFLNVEIGSMLFSLTEAEALDIAVELNRAVRTNILKEVATAFPRS